MPSKNNANFLKSIRGEILRCVCIGGHVRLLEEVIRLLGVKAKDLYWGWGSPPLWIAANNGNLDQVSNMLPSSVFPITYTWPIMSHVDKQILYE